MKPLKMSKTLEVNMAVIKAWDILQKTHEPVVVGEKGFIGDGRTYIMSCSDHHVTVTDDLGELIYKVQKPMNRGSAQERLKIADTLLRGTIQPVFATLIKEHCFQWKVVRSICYAYGIMTLDEFATAWRNDPDIFKEWIRIGPKTIDGLQQIFEIHNKDVALKSMGIMTQ